MDSQTLLYAVPLCGALALIYAAVRGSWIGKQDAGNDRMTTIAGHIREGAMAFLSREYRVLGGIRGRANLARPLRSCAWSRSKPAFHKECEMPGRAVPVSPRQVIRPASQGHARPAC